MAGCRGKGRDHPRSAGLEGKLPEDAQFMMDRVEAIDGFDEASGMERLPTEIARTAQVAKSTQIRRKSQDSPGLANRRNP